jgi:hypothetical protein
MRLIALAPLVGDHEPARVPEGGLLNASDCVAQQLILRGLAVPADLLQPDRASMAAQRERDLERAFVAAAEAIAEAYVRRRRRR